MKKILMTGHLGLVGRHLKPLLELKGYEIVGFDLSDQSGDICNSEQLNQAIKGCVGVIHLAAVSRVIWGEKNPDLCWKTNALASENLLNHALNSTVRPWVLVASSREVYGEPLHLPVVDFAPIVPVNIYGRAKAYMEEKALQVREGGLNIAIVRLANVYGCTEDHRDRVLPAFCYHASQNLSLRVDGKDHLFDFTHISDAALGLVLVVEQLENNERNLPPLHLLPGIGTTLMEAAEIAIAAAGSNSEIIEAPSRKYDVSRFIGDPTRARTLLGWKAKITPKRGIEELVNAFKNKTVRELSA
jgi:nucleoside-diphosphate-sugar epimerase